MTGHPQRGSNVSEVCGTCYRRVAASREELREQGWIDGDDGGIYCPKCSATMDPREVAAVERAHLTVADRLRATRGSVYDAFRNTACGLDPDVLEVWWEESPAAQSMGDQSGKAFGCALSVAMMAVEADRKLRRQSGTDLIAAERERQVKVCNWTPRHDDDHESGELAAAAVCYLQPWSQCPSARWPWERKAWRPSNDPIRNLVKAGALIAAEIDRLQRQGEAHAS